MTKLSMEVKIMDCKG